MTILNVFLSMGIPAIDVALEKIVTQINHHTPGDLMAITSIARVIGLIAALCVASYECWVMMLGRRSLDIFKILRIVGLSLCISSSSVICAAISLPGKELAGVSQNMARRKNGEIKALEKKVAQLQEKYYKRIRVLQDSIESAKRIQEIGDDPAWYDKIIYSVKNLGTTIDNFSKRAAIVAESKITEWVNLIIRFIGECIFQISYFSLLLMQAVFLQVLGMFAPLAFAMSIAPPWSSAWSQWVSKYATISLWAFLVYLFVFYADFIIEYTLHTDIKAYTALIGNAKGTWAQIKTFGMQGVGTTCMYFVGMCVGAVLLKSVPEVASWLIPGGVSSSTAGSAGTSMIGTAQTAGAAAMGAAAGVKAVASKGVTIAGGTVRAGGAVGSAVGGAIASTVRNVNNAAQTYSSTKGLAQATSSLSSVFPSGRDGNNSSSGGGKSSSPSPSFPPTK